MPNKMNYIAQNFCPFRWTKPRILRSDHNEETTSLYKNSCMTGSTSMSYTNCMHYEHHNSSYLRWSSTLIPPDSTDFSGSGKRSKNVGIKWQAFSSQWMRKHVFRSFGILSAESLKNLKNTMLLASWGLMSHKELSPKFRFLLHENGYILLYIIKMMNSRKG